MKLQKYTYIIMALVCFGLISVMSPEARANRKIQDHNSVAGTWTGTVYDDRGAMQLNVNLYDQNGSLQGSYTLTEPGGSDVMSKGSLYGTRAEKQVFLASNNGGNMAVNLSSSNRMTGSMMVMATNRGGRDMRMRLVLNRQ